MTAREDQIRALLKKDHLTVRADGQIYNDQGKQLDYSDRSISEADRELIYELKNGHAPQVDPNQPQGTQARTPAAPKSAEEARQIADAQRRHETVLEPAAKKAGEVLNNGVKAVLNAPAAIGAAAAGITATVQNATESDEAFLAKMKAKTDKKEAPTADESKKLLAMLGKRPDKYPGDKRSDEEVKRAVAEWDAKSAKFTADLDKGTVDWQEFGWLREHAAPAAAAPDEDKETKKSGGLDAKSLIGGGIGAVLAWFVGSMFGAGPFGMIVSAMLAVGGFFLGSKFGKEHLGNLFGGGKDKAGSGNGRSDQERANGQAVDRNAPYSQGPAIPQSEQLMSDEEFQQVLQASHGYAPYPGEEPRKHHRDHSGGFLGLHLFHKHHDRYDDGRDFDRDCPRGYTVNTVVLTGVSQSVVPHGGQFSPDYTPGGYPQGNHRHRSSW